MTKPDPMNPNRLRMAAACARDRLRVGGYYEDREGALDELSKSFSVNRDALALRVPVEGL